MKCICCLRGYPRVQAGADDGGEDGEVVVVLRVRPLLEGGVEAHAGLFACCGGGGREG